MGRPEVGHEDHAGALVKGQYGRGTPTGGGASARFVDELVGEQRVEALRDRGPCQTRTADEVGTGYRLPVPDQAEQGPRAGHVEPIVIQTAIDGSKAEQAAYAPSILAESWSYRPTNSAAFTRNRM